MHKPYQVLSFYCFAPVEDPAHLRQAHHLFCLGKNLRGRIKIAPEGINGKLSGLQEDCQAYTQYLRADPRFANADIKTDPHTAYASEKLHVRIKKETVDAGLPHLKPYEKTGTRLTPQAFEKMIQEKDVVILDTRSDFETDVGKFKGSIVLNMQYFRDFPQYLPQLAKYKDKPIITVCTGGIRTEKASAYLISQGFTKVYQLQGGILRYGKETDGSAFEGVCYVFDNRLTVDVNTANPTLISHCYLCQTPSKRIVNCANMVCNRHVPICEPCGEQYQGACSTTCQKSPHKRPYNATGYYTKESHGYNPYKDAKRMPTSA